MIDRENGGTKIMFARVSVIQGKSEQVEEGIRHYHEQVLPQARKMTGFKGAYLLVDRKSGKNLGITFWDTEKDLQASATAANKLRAQGVKITESANPPLVEIYEVAEQSV
jgi:heme-degrading monooxygenase HmoA